MSKKTNIRRSEQGDRYTAEGLISEKAFSENPNSILAKGYIDGQIKQEVQEQAEKVTKDEIDKLKADWKGDLFGQISFPVIFTIASIFAAFAVKDILTEILKQEEKDKVKRELEHDLIPMISETVETNPVLVQRLQSVEAYTSWLEHELLKIIIDQVLEELKNLQILFPKKICVHLRSF